MGATESVILGALAIFAIFLIYNFFLRAKTDEPLSDISGQAFPVWAAQGPFDCGADSASAMRKAYLAVLGFDETEKLSDGIRQHATAYDDDPGTWEESRRRAVEVANSEALILAEGIACAESFNINFIAQDGDRSEFTKQPDENTSRLNSENWSDEALEEKSERDAEETTSDIGSAIINGSTEEAQKLYKLLRGVYRSKTNKEPNEEAIGRTWLTFLAMRDENPSFEFSKTFNKLFDSYSAALPNTDINTPVETTDEHADDSRSLNESDAERFRSQTITNPERRHAGLLWSERPGAYEQHLRRKYKNPFFPESERVVTQAQINEARKKDKQHSDTLQAEIEKILDAAQDLSKKAQTGDLSDLREPLSDVLMRSVEIGEKQTLHEGLEKLRANLVNTLRDAFASDPEASEMINATEVAHQSYWARFITRYSRADSAISREEFILSLLSEEPNVIENFAEMVGYDVSKQFLQLACELIVKNENAGVFIPSTGAKLHALERGMLAVKTTEQEE